MCTYIHTYIALHIYIKKFTHYLSLKLISIPISIHLYLFLKILTYIYN